MPTRVELEQLADEVAARHSIPPAIFKGLVTHESAWNVRAFRNEPKIGDASRGLTQVLLRTAQSEGYTGTAEGLFDPATNLEYGARYLARQYRRWQDWPAALAAYNGGPSAGQRVSVATTTVLARDQVTGEPVRTFTAQPGSFRNQPYVDAVTDAARRYGVTLAGGGAVLSSLLLLGLLGALWRLRAS